MIYFDNGATSFIKPESVYSAVYRTMRLYAGNPGRSGHRLSMLANDIVYNTRETVAEFFGIANSDRVCFTNNATTALNYAIKGILKKDDKVAISAYEHNSVTRPLFAVGADVSIIDFNKTINCENDVKMIIVNHMSNVNGAVADISSIGDFARRNNIIFMVDASQSAGHITIDVEAYNIDILVCSGHKGLYGPQGTGIMYIREGLEIKSIIEGGTGSFSDKLTQPDVFPDMFESGTLNVAGISGLMEGIKYINEYDIIKKGEYEKLLTDRLIKGLENIQGATVCKAGNYGPVVSFNLEGWDCVTLSNYLSETYDICVRGGLHCAPLAHKTIGTSECGTLRVSLSSFNTMREIEQFLYIIDKTSHMM